MSRTVDTSAAGKVDLGNTDAVSGATVTNTQREVNGLGAFTGRAAGGTFNSTPTYANENVITTGQTLKAAIEALDAEHNPSSGSLASRAGREVIAEGVSQVNVTFSTTWPDTNYVLSYVFENLTDTDPIFLQGMITDRPATGFTMRLNAPTDSGNYVLHWAIRKAA